MNLMLVLLIALAVLSAALYVVVAAVPRSGRRVDPDATADDIIRRCSRQRQEIDRVNRERTPSAPRRT